MNTPKFYNTQATPCNPSKVECCFHCWLILHSVPVAQATAGCFNYAHESVLRKRHQQNNTTKDYGIMPLKDSCLHCWIFYSLWPEVVEIILSRLFPNFHTLSQRLCTWFCEFYGFCTSHSLSFNLHQDIVWKHTQILKGIDWFWAFSVLQGIFVCAPAHFPLLLKQAPSPRTKLARQTCMVLCFSSRCSLSSASLNEAFSLLTLKWTLTVIWSSSWRYLLFASQVRVDCLLFLKQALLDFCSSGMCSSPSAQTAS